MKQSEIGNLFTQSAGVIRKLAQERDELKEKVASLEQSKRVEKLAHSMREKQINPEFSEEDLIKRLEKQAADGRLDVVEQAVSMSSSGNFVGMQDVAGGSEGVKQSEISGSNLESFILTGNNEGGM